MANRSSRLSPSRSHDKAQRLPGASTPAVILALIFAIVAAWLLNGVADGRLPEQVPLNLAGADQPTAQDEASGAAQALSETRPLRE